MAKISLSARRFRESAELLRATISLKILIFLAAIVLATLAVPASRAQFQQPLVFSSAGAVAVRNDQTGALTPVSGSPFSPSNGFTIDVQGRFLFSLGANSIHMFQVTDSTTGAYQETPGSPFASPNTNQPTFIAVEPTGQFIAVVDTVSQNPGEALVETFQIATTSPGGPALIPVAGSAVELDSTPVGAAQPPSNTTFLIFMGPNPNSQNSTLLEGSEFQALSIDPTAGFLTGLQSGNSSSQRGLSFAMDPQGRYYVTGTRDNLLETGSIQIFGLDGKITSTTVSLPMFIYPIALWIDSTGSFVYAAVSDLNNPTVVQIYSLNFQTSQLTETASSPLPGFSTVPAYVPDPTGHFNYGFGADQNTALAYTVDPLTGYFIETSNSPFTIPQISGSLAFSIPPGQQGISGPSALLSASSLSFGSLQTGSTSAPQVITLTSNGGEALSVNSITLTGADPSQFSESDTCQAPSVLAPGKFCSISIAFTPTTTGGQQANVSISDNAPGSPQTVSLSGTGVAPPPPEPAVSINPISLAFPTTTQGTTSSPMTLLVTNSGNATLHITSVLLGGNNSSDFSMANTCNGPYAPNVSCSISVTFTPLAAGQRSATITISDDAQNSPQIVQVTGSATAAQPTTPLVALSSGSLTFGTITQGASSATQSITVTNSGGAALHISSVVLAGASPSDFSLTNGCTAASYAVNAACSLSVSFAPLSTGARSATITLTDDAPTSPQTIAITGTANPAVTAGVAPNGSASATITAGQTAQYNLQLTPGAGFSGTVALSCTGAPLAGACQVPASVQITNGNPVPFAVSVTTTGSSSAVLPGIVSRILLPGRLAPPCAIAGLTALFLLAIYARRGFNVNPRRLALGGAFPCAILLVALGLGGCGGGTSAITQPPPVVTPQGTSTITVTPSATSSSGKPLQLQPIQLTLTVT